MSVSIDFLKAVDEKVSYGHTPLAALSSVIGIGITVGIIDKIQRISDKNTSNPEDKNLIAGRVRLVRTTLYATGALAYAGLVLPNPKFVLWAGASLAFSCAVMLSLRSKVVTLDNGKLAKLVEAVNHAFIYLIPVATAITYTLVIAASHKAFAEKD